jgi:sporulation protein YlmC with PRC-barrel domain
MATATVNRVIGRKYVIGSRVYCAECPCGYLVSAVVDPATRRLEHLIVMPDHGIDSRLVPIATAHCEGEAVRLGCTLDDFAAMEPAVDVHITPMDAARPARHVPDEESSAWPFFDLGPSEPRLGLAAPEPVLMPRMAYDDHVPVGEARIYPGDHVHASDGAIGHVRGVVVAPEGDAVTHILVDQGLLRGHKRVAIPMELVGGVGEDGVRVLMTRREVKGMAPCEVVAA